MSIVQPIREQNSKLPQYLSSHFPGLNHDEDRIRQSLYSVYQSGSGH